MTASQYWWMPNDVVAARVTVKDAEGLSHTVDVAILPPEVLGPGQVCDPRRTTNVCSAGLMCLQQLQTDPTGNLKECRVPAVECPGDWSVVELNGHADGLGWQYSGNNADAAEHASGYCSSYGGTEVVLGFAAPSAGDYRFEATAIQEHTFDFYARAYCGIYNVEASLACVPAPYGTLASAFTLSMTAGQRVFLFVDERRDTPVSGGGPVAFTVRAQRL